MISGTLNNVCIFRKGVNCVFIPFFEITNIFGFFEFVNRPIFSQTFTEKLANSLWEFEKSGNRSRLYHRKFSSFFESSHFSPTLRNYKIVRIGFPQLSAEFYQKRDWALFLLHLSPSIRTALLPKPQFSLRRFP